MATATVEPRKGPQSSTWANGPVKLSLDGWLAGKLRKEHATLFVVLTNNVMDLEVGLRSGGRVSLREFSIKTDEPIQAPISSKQKKQDKKGRIPVSPVMERLVKEETTPHGASSQGEIVSKPDSSAGIVSFNTRAARAALGTDSDLSGFQKVLSKKEKRLAARSMGKGTPVRSPFPEPSASITADPFSDSNSSVDSEYSSVMTDGPDSAHDSEAAYSVEESKVNLREKETTIRARLTKIGRNSSTELPISLLLKPIKKNEPELYAHILDRNKVWREYAIERSLPGFVVAHSNRKNPPRSPPSSVKEGGPLVRRSSEVLAVKSSTHKEEADQEEV